VIDAREVKLNLRYPESRQEDITDAFMRGYTNAVEIGNKAIEKLEIENMELRKLLKLETFVLEAIESGTSWRFVGDGTTYDSAYFKGKLCELGVES